MKYIPVGIDIAKYLMQVHFIDEHTGEVIDKQIKRDALLESFCNRESCLIGIEACVGSQYWPRELEKLSGYPAGKLSEVWRGSAAKQVVEQGPVVVEKRQQQMRHGERDVLPVAVWQDVQLLGNPLLGGLEAATATSLGLAALTEEEGVCAVRRSTAVTANTHETDAAGKHALDGQGPHPAPTLM